MAFSALTDMSLTVAVCTYNPNPDLMSRVMAAIARQRVKSGDFEVIVVDNNSNPPVADLGYESESGIRVIVEPSQGLTAARAAAIREARGSIIVFVDDDNVLADGYLDTVLAAFAHYPQLGLLGGSVVPEYEREPPTWFKEFEPQLALRRYEATDCIETTDIPCSDVFPVGAGFSVRRELALAYLRDCEVAGKIEGRRGAILSSGEDIDLGLFVLQTGHTLAVTGRLQLTHVIPASRVDGGYLRSLMVGTIRSTVELEDKWSTRYGRPVFPFLAESTASACGKAAVALALSPLSPRYGVKYCVFKALAMAKLEARWASRTPPSSPLVP